MGTLAATERNVADCIGAQSESLSDRQIPASGIIHPRTGTSTLAPAVAMQFAMTVAHRDYSKSGNHAL
jgi:hypothetical protein